MLKIFTLREKAKKEAYTFFDKYIRKLPKTKNGDFDEENLVFHNSEVDAFRHAYTSGVYLLEFNELIADKLGQANEFFNLKNLEEDKNMDLWNNAVGRKYAKKVKNRYDLAKLLYKALKNGELIVNPKDSRKYQEQDLSYSINLNKHVVAIQKSKTGRNEIFLDLTKKSLLTREQFIADIQQGVYLGYKIVNRNNLLIPMSKQDQEIENNLG